MGQVGSEREQGGADRVSIRALGDDDGLAIDDRIERRRCEVRTRGPVEPVSVHGSPFRYPVDTAVRVTTDRLSFEGPVVAFVHGGDEVAEVGIFESASFEAGRYELEFSGPIKLYISVDGPFQVETSIAGSQVVLERSGEVEIGARSHHERPAATVTTTPEPTDVMAAVSTFGSAMKTTRSVRSYPTLRGHPPTLEVGDELSLPDGLAPPDSAVRIEVPASLRNAMVVSSLAYYLGCRVVPGAEPQLVVDGEPVPLDGEHGFETAVERTLKKTFLLDSVVRTAGPRSIPLYERRGVEPELDVDVEDLYGRTSAERLRAYAEVPYESVAEYLPTWRLTAHVQPVASSLEMLPFLANDLAIVRSPSSLPTTAGPSVQSADEPVDESLAESTTRSPTADRDDAEPWVQVEPTGSLEQVWVGHGTPMGASKALPDAYRNKFDRSPRDEEIDIVVVCNDERMLEERDGVEAVYGTRQEYDFDVTFYEELTTDRLELVLESDIDFLHYIGHVDARGFECADGVLDPSTLRDVGVDIFFLNACRSYHQGRRLIENGAISGVVTLDDVIDSGAVRIGKTLAELLNYGFPLRSALNVARDRSIVGSQYLVIGDGNADLAQVESGNALLADVTSTGDGYELDLEVYPATGAGVGSQFRPAIPGSDQVYLCPRTTPSFELSQETLEEYFATSVFPVRLDGDLTWSDRVPLSDRE